MCAIRSNGALWQSGEHRVPAPSPAPRAEPGRLAAVEIGALHRELARWKVRAAELERRLAVAEAEALGSQLTPHFLCNSLQAVSTLLHRDARAADAMVRALSDLLRMALRDAGTSEVPLARELQLVQRYVEVMRFRFGPGLRLIIDVSPEAREALVPQMLLQPLVENALVHGFDDRTGTIRVSADRRGDTLCCTVSDDGRGLPPGPLVERIGLGGARARLRAMYGERCQLQLTQNEADGVTVQLSLPYRTVMQTSEVKP